MATPEELRDDRHGWMIDHDTGAILHHEIAERALYKAMLVFIEANAKIADPKASEAEKRCYRALVDQGVESYAAKIKAGMVDSANHMAWRWRVAHGDFSDTYFLSDVEIVGLSTDGPIGRHVWETPPGDAWRTEETRKRIARERDVDYAIDIARGK